MHKVNSTGLPKIAISNRFNAIEGVYIDCFSLVVDRDVTHEEFVFAFYTSRIFKLERFILHYLLHMSSTDKQAKEIAEGLTEHFAAWTVEGRSDNQLLMCDFQKITRSWFMVMAESVSGMTKTTLYFGSVIVPVEDKETGEFKLGRTYRALLGFHRLYSHVLLYSANSRLKKLATSKST